MYCETPSYWLSDDSNAACQVATKDKRAQDLTTCEREIWGPFKLYEAPNSGTVQVTTSKRKAERTTPPSHPL